MMILDFSQITTTAFLTSHKVCSFQKMNFGRTRIFQNSDFFRNAVYENPKNEKQTVSKKAIFQNQQLSVFPKIKNQPLADLSKLSSIRLSEYRRGSQGDNPTVNSAFFACWGKSIYFFCACDLYLRISVKQHIPLCMKTKSPAIHTKRKEYRMRKIQKLIKYDSEEYAAVCKKAEKAKLRVGTYIRVISVYGEIKNYDMETYKDLIIAISRVETSVNQIAKVVNTTKSVYQKDMDDLKAEMERLNTVLDDFLSPLKYTVETV